MSANNKTVIHMATVDIKNPEIHSLKFHHIPKQPYHGIKGLSFWNHNDKTKSKKKRVTKADIGTPGNFQHKVHLSMDPNTCFQLCILETELKNLVKTLLKEMCKVIHYPVRKKVKRQAPLPPSDVLLPPCSHPSPIQSSASFKGRRRAPPRPLFPPPPPPVRAPQSLVGSGGSSTPAPPAPPPPAPSLQVPNGGGGCPTLAEQIRGGIHLKKVEQKHKVLASHGGQGTLLRQIQQGVQLKHVSDHPCSFTSPPTKYLIRILKEALEIKWKWIDPEESNEDEDDDERDN